MNRIPPDLLWHVFNHLSNDEMYPPRHVNRAWRDVATAHPRFWGKIYIGSSRMSYINIAKLQFAAAGKRPFTLTVELVDRRGAPRMLDRAVRFMHHVFLQSLLPFMRTVLNQVCGMRLVIHERYLSAIYSALLYPAQQLEYFEMWVLDRAENVTMQVPSSLFNHYAPKLHLLYLHEVDIPSPTPSVFHGVDEMVLSYDPRTMFRFPPAVAVTFPMLKKLTLYGGHVQLGHPSSLDVLAASRLDIHLDVGSAEELESFCKEFRQFLSSLPMLSFWAPRSSIMRMQLEDLAAPWHLSFMEIRRGEIQIDVESESSGKTRAFCDDLVPENKTVSALLLRNCEFLRGVRRMTIATSVWPVVHHLLPALDNLEEFRVYINTPRLPVEHVGGIRHSGHHVVRLDLERGRDFFRTRQADLQCFISHISVHDTSANMDRRIFIVE